MSPSTSTQATTQPPTFEGLDVRPMINCRGTYTIITGSRVLDQVSQAMAEATDHYVHMDELMRRVGERLAELTGAEWGYVSSGCAAALTEVAAACIAGADPERMARLPDTTGMKDEIVMQKAHRNAYDRAIRMTGARIVEARTEADLEAAIGERTAMIAITGDQAHLGQIPVETTIEIGHRHGVPCLVDAAAERPDVPNRYLEMGADAVAYSGGKCLRGPQASGLVLGREDLLWAAYLNGAPHHGLGRPMKAGKEEIMGLLAAVEAWVLGRDHEAEWAMWEGYLETVRAAVIDLPSVRAEVEQPGVANVAPTMVISWDQTALRRTPAGVHDALYEGEPRIAVHLMPEGLRIMPYMMEEGEDRIVADRLRELLTAGHEPSAAADESAQPEASDVSGDWIIDVQYTLGSSRHSMILEQAGSELEGTYRSRYSRGEVSGRIHGREVAFQTLLGYQSNTTEYAYTGTYDGKGVMSGTVRLGEFGDAEWRAERNHTSS